MAHWFAIIVAVLLLMALPEPVAAQVSCSQIGNQVFCSNGQSCTGIGNQTFDSRGNSWNQIGNQTFGSNGTSCTTIGTQMFCR